MGVDRSLRVFPCLPIFSLSLYIYVRMCYSIYLYIYTDYKWEKNSKLETNTSDKTKNSKEREIDRIRYHERQQRVVPILGKERKLSYCTINMILSNNFTTYVSFKIKLKVEIYWSKQKDHILRCRCFTIDFDPQTTKY